MTANNNINTQMAKARVLCEMERVFMEEMAPGQIEHTMNVLKYAEDIMDGENIGEDKRELISIVAILHDIGIPEAIKKYNSSRAEFQEREGEAIAREILEGIGYEKPSTDRVCYIVGYHHTKDKIDGIDFQIQWEADLLENMKAMFDKSEKDKIKKCIEENFKTSTGKSLAIKTFLLD